MTVNTGVGRRQVGTPSVCHRSPLVAIGGHRGAQMHATQMHAAQMHAAQMHAAQMHAAAHLWNQ